MGRTLRCVRALVAAAFLVVASAGMAGCGGTEPSEFDYRDWKVVGGDQGVSHYSELDQINRHNVEQLERAWVYHSHDTVMNPWAFWGGSTIQANPIVVDGVLYGTTPSVHMIALDAGTGEEIWRFNPFEEGEHGNRNRGVAYWAEGDDRRLFYSTGSKLWAIDAKTGTPIRSFGAVDSGYVEMEFEIAGQTGSKTSPSAPVIYEDLIIMGGISNTLPSNITAYDARTGERRWIFHNVPHPGEVGYETYGDSTYWRTGAGVSAWSGLSVDEEHGMVFYTTSSANPDLYRPLNSGKHLFGNSVVALDAETGEYAWHWQELHHELWDVDMLSAPILAEFDRHGETVPGLIALSKTGRAYLFNRLTGELLSDVEERAVPPSPLDGEHAYPTQPVLHDPEPFSRVFQVKKSHLTDLSEEKHRRALERWKQLDTEWFHPPSEKGVLFYGIHGGAEWPGGAFDPTNDHLYINANNVPWIVEATQQEEVHPGRVVYRETGCSSCHGPEQEGRGGMPGLKELATRYEAAEIRRIVREGRNAMPAHPDLSGEDMDNLVAFLTGEDPVHAIDREVPFYEITRFEKFLDRDGYPAVKPPWGTLNAIDLSTGEITWKVPLGVHEELAQRGLDSTGTENFGGPLVTRGGLVFIAATKDEKFRAFDKETGEVLWETQLPAGGYATPSTYLHEGEQYVVIAAGGGGKPKTEPGDEYVAFKLGD